jgi:hypothetical protein
MRIRILSLFLALAAAPAFAEEPLPLAEASVAEPSLARRGDLGVRYWLSTGETKRSHNAQGFDPTLGNPTSVLLYENLDANVLELFGRQNFRNNMFLKGTLGVGRINRGSFDDKDFERGQVLTDHTTSSVAEGRIGYGTIDLGYQWVLRDGAVTLGVYGGFTQWTEEVDAYGATDHVGTIGDISRNTLVITNKAVWRALRVGFAGEFAFGTRLRLALDLAAVPYARVRDEDSHYLRDDLGPVPNIILEGEGWGVQWDAELRYEIARRTELGIGVRYWHMEIIDGTRQLPNFPGFPELPLTELYSSRVGVTLSLRRVW